LNAKPGKSVKCIMKFVHITTISQPSKRTKITCNWLLQCWTCGIWW